MSTFVLDLILKRYWFENSRVHMDQIRFFLVWFTGIPRGAILRQNKSRIFYEYFKSLLHDTTASNFNFIDKINSTQSFNMRSRIYHNTSKQLHESQIHFEKIKILKRKLTKIVTQLLLQEINTSIKCLFGSVVKVTIESDFCSKIHQNDVFYLFFKNHH